LDATGPTILPELQQFERDLIGEGYRVVLQTVDRVPVPRVRPADTNPATIQALFGPWKSAVIGVKNSIRAAYATNPDLRNIILVGHVPVPYSGKDPSDGHDNIAPYEHQGAWPADVF
jgi:hypothetical protein